MERLEKSIADHPDSLPDRQALQRFLISTGAVSPEKVRAARRAQILWMIEHHPDAKFLDEQAWQLWTKGKLGDPEGFEQAARLWKEQAAKADASPKTVANAALFFKVTDPAQGFAILDAHPESPETVRARGILHVAVLFGVSGVDDSNAQLRLTTSAALRATPAAHEARSEIESSKDANLMGGAGEFLAHTVILPNDLTFGDDDAPALAERWLRRAIELAPPGAEYKASLGETLRTKANRTIDPQEKVRLLQEAQSLVPDGAKPGILQTLAIAEFDAGQDDDAARDAQQLLTLAPKNANAYNAAQTVLGRIAAAKGDLVEAKRRLAASVTMPPGIKKAVFQPNMALAQDIYDAGDKDAVIQFLEASRALWKFDRGRIDRMISFIRKAPTVDMVQLSNQFPGNGIIRNPAPAFEATDADGQKWTREQLLGKVVALEFGAAPLAEKAAKDRGAVLLQVTDADTRRRFEVLTNPTLVVIDRQGIVTGYRSGESTEAEWRNEVESGFGKGTNPVASLPAPTHLETGAFRGEKVTLTWEPVETAASYVVEWDTRDEKGWIFDQDKSVRVIATADASATLDLKGFTRVRWRVYAVPKNGASGKTSPWQEIDGVPVTKIYK